MEIFEIIAWINFISLNGIAFLTFFFYILSVMPFTREKKVGEKAWKECAKFRAISDVLCLVLIVNIFLWIWFPIKTLNWEISENYIILILISIIIGVPCIYIIVKAVKDAGSETVKTSKDTEMYGGIYNHIRHPQILGSIPLFFVFCLLINSLFLLIWIALIMIFIIPIVIHFEEKDLIKKYGDKYFEYKKNTGVLIPKFLKKKQ